VHPVACHIEITRTLVSVETAQVWQIRLRDTITSGTSDRDAEDENVGTWDVGPFDNDTAADWCGGLHDADPTRRVEVIRATLAAVADHGDGYLDSDLAVEAIAAAAIVASQLPGGPPVTSPYAPKFLVSGGAVDVPVHGPALALRALDRITADNSEWRDLWEEDPDSYAQAVASLLPIRTTLERART
jgi:hypothetical protein